MPGNVSKIEVPMPIRTPRLELRVPDPVHAAALAEAVRETWADLTPWMPWAQNIEEETVENKRVYLQEAVEKFAAREDLSMLAFEREGGRLVAATGLHRMNWEIPSFEIGYWVRSSAQGRGYATEISKGLLRYAFSALNARRVEIGHAEGNEASAAVIRKLGIPLEGVHRNDHRLPDGRLVGGCIYAAIPGDPLPDITMSCG